MQKGNNLIQIDPEKFLEDISRRIDEKIKEKQKEVSEDGEEKI